MKKCESCALVIVTKNEHCPFCSKKLISSEGVVKNPIYYPKKPLTTKDVKKTERLILKMGVILGGICLLLNLLTWVIKPVLWSFVVIAAYLYAGKFLTVYMRDFWKGKFGRSLVTHYIFLSFFVTTIDWVTGFSGWSLNYVIPLLRIISVILIGSIAFYRGSFWTSEFGYILTLFATNVFSVLMLFSDSARVIWPSMLSNCFMGVMLIILIRLKPNELKEEIKKKLHY